MSTPIVIDEDKISELRQHAELHFIDIKEMERLMAGDVTPIGDRPGYACLLDFGYRLVFSIEEHPLKKGGTVWFRHMSLSLNQHDRTPNEYAMGQVGKLLGFPIKDHKLDYEKCSMWMENCPGPLSPAINAMCQIEKRYKLKHPPKSTEKPNGS